MNYQWKNQSLQEVIKYNKHLLVSVVALSILSLVLSFALVNKEDKWVLIPTNDISNRIEISNTKLYPSYLKSWAKNVARDVFTTSPEEVIEQHTQIRKISSSNKQLSNFFNKQLDFVQGNNASSVFFVKEAKLGNNAVLVNGTLHYWFAGSNQKITLEKHYLVSYRQAERGLILLTNIEEQTLSSKNKT